MNRVFTLLAGAGLFLSVVSFAQQADTNAAATTNAATTNTTNAATTNTTNAATTNNNTTNAEASAMTSSARTSSASGDATPVPVSGVVYTDASGWVYASGNVRFEVKRPDQNTATATATNASSNRSQGGQLYSVFVSVDDSAFTTMKQKERISFSEPGAHSINYYTRDKLGNLSDTQRFLFVLDLNAPEVSLSSTQNVYRTNGVNYISTNYQFTLSAFDTDSGVQVMYFSTNRSSQKEHAYTAPFGMPAEEGFYTISYRAVDNVGNSSPMQQRSVYVDVAAPEVRIDTNTLVLDEATQTYYASSRVNIRLDAEDQHTAVGKILYSIDGAEFQTYRFPLRVTVPGKHELRVKAVDVLGNESAEQSLSFTVDPKVPEAQLEPVKNSTMAPANDTNGGIPTASQ